MEQDRVAFRLAYEEEIGGREFLVDQLERSRTRASAFLLATAITSGGGLVLLSPELLKDKGTPTWQLIVMFGGLIAALVGAGALSFNLRGAIRLDPETLIGKGTSENYNNDRLYMELARAHHRFNRELARKVSSRRWWLYLSIFGMTAELVGLIALSYYALT